MRLSSPQPLPFRDSVFNNFASQSQTAEVGLGLRILNLTNSYLNIKVGNGNGEKLQIGYGVQRE